MTYDEPIPAAAVRDPADGLPPEIWDEPLAEDETHFLVIKYVFDALRFLLRDRDDVNIAADGAVQWDPTDLRRHLAPDVYVSEGVPRHKRRRSYAKWVEGKGLDLVFEITSESTWKEDLGRKHEVYQGILDVREYVLFDPEARWIRPALQLHRRDDAGGVLVPVEPDATGRFTLQTIEADLVAEGERLVVIDRRTGQPVPDFLEETDARESAEAARDAAEAARDAAERRAAELEAELRRLRGEEPQA